MIKTLTYPFGTCGLCAICGVYGGGGGMFPGAIIGPCIAIGVAI